MSEPETVGDILDRLPPAGIGHNNPPDPIEVLRSELAQEHGPMIARQAELLAMGQRAPAAITDRETEAKIINAIKALAAFDKYSEKARTAAKEPHLAACRAVDGWFKGLADPVETLRRQLQDMLTKYQREKEAAERRKREEEARLAEAKRRDEERQRREAEAQAREAARKLEEADRARRDAEAAADRARTKAAREAAEKAHAEAEEKARAAARAAEAAADAASEAAGRAAVAQTEALNSKDAAREKPAELSRARTDMGAVASLKRSWEYEIEDVEQIPRMFLTPDHAAIKAFVKARTDKKTGECSAKIPGVKLIEKHEAVVR